MNLQVFLFNNNFKVVALANHGDRKWQKFKFSIYFVIQNMAKAAVNLKLNIHCGVFDHQWGYDTAFDERFPVLFASQALLPHTHAQCICNNAAKRYTFLSAEGDSNKNVQAKTSHWLSD